MSLTYPAKPSQWSLDPAFAQHQDLWDGLVVAVPFWEGGGIPMAYIPSRGGFVQMTVNTGTYLWEKQRTGVGMAHAGSMSLSVDFNPDALGWPNNDMSMACLMETDGIDIGDAIFLADNGTLGNNIVKYQLQSSTVGYMSRINNVGSARFTNGVVVVNEQDVIAFNFNPTSYAEHYRNGVFDVENTEARVFDTATTLRLSFQLSYQADTTGSDCQFSAGSFYLWRRRISQDEMNLLNADPFAPLRFRRGRIAQFFAAAGGFQPFWAARANTVIQPGIR